MERTTRFSSSTQISSMAARTSKQEPDSSARWKVTHRADGTAYVVLNFLRYRVSPPRLRFRLNSVRGSLVPVSGVAFHSLESGFGMNSSLCKTRVVVESDDVAA